MRVICVAFLWICSLRPTASTRPACAEIFVSREAVLEEPTVHLHTHKTSWKSEGFFILQHNQILNFSYLYNHKYLMEHSERVLSFVAFSCRFRLRNKKSSCVGRAFPLAPGVMNKTFSMEAGIHTDVSAGVGSDLKGTAENAGAKMEGVPGLAHQSLISRGTDGKRPVPNGISGGGNGVPGTNRASAGSSDPYVDHCSYFTCCRHLLHFCSSSPQSFFILILILNLQHALRITPHLHDHLY